MTYSEQRRMRQFQQRKGLRPRFEPFQLMVCVILAIIVPVVVMQFASSKQELTRYQVANVSEVQQ